MSSRPAIVFLLAAAMATAACDRGSPANGQAEANAADAATATSPDEAPAAAPRASAVDRTHKGEPAPAAVFTAPDGKQTTLAALTGKPLLVNLWATWCAPCVKELPTLDAAARAAGERMRVVAVSQDMDPAKAKAFLSDKGYAAIAPYTDPKLALSLAYGANLPTTILYGADGKELWRVAGDMDWTGEKAKALLAEAGCSRSTDAPAQSGAQGRTRNARNPGLRSAPEHGTHDAACASPRPLPSPRIRVASLPFSRSFG